ncbi:Uncharacterized protein Fot_32412 [Forsythia ovata]|uniref:Uncharacterized protein n=1 Tax=Forsythia ovata TaxID=205694 RepID=A0ABD1T7W1_9LAMI
MANSSPTILLISNPQHTTDATTTTTQQFTVANSAVCLLFSQISDFLLFFQISAVAISIFLPFVPSVFRLETSLYSFARAQELASLVPEFRPAFYFSNELVPRPVGINSQVTIEEIQENAQGEEGEETRVINEANSAQWRASCLSNIMTQLLFTVDTVENKGKSS